MDTNILDKNFEEEYNRYVKDEQLLPIKVTDFYLAKVYEEVAAIGTGGPLYNSVIPTKDRLRIKSSVETRDYVEEGKHLPIQGVEYIVQKYKDRLIFLVTDICYGHCQYCFRTYNLSKFQQSNLRKTLQHKTAVLKQYLCSHPDVKEIILSGGDPMSIGYDNLFYVLEELCNWNLRIHTRSIIYEPDVFTEKIINLMKLYNVRLVFHINHPYEICTYVEKVVKKIEQHGVHMYAQFPLLRGINDSSIVLRKLLEKMDLLNIRVLSIFLPDPLAYSAVFRVSYHRIMDIMDEINWYTPSWINSTRFVMDTTIGKVRRENIVKWENDCITFSRDNKYVLYYDLDKDIDIPSDIRVLLWRDYKMDNLFEN